MLKKLQAKLAKVEKDLDKCRTSVLEDGWQTMRYAKKARKWDILAQEKMKILQQIDELPCPVNQVCQCNRPGIDGCLLKKI